MNLKGFFQSDEGKSYKYLKYIAYTLWAGAVGGVLATLIIFISLSGKDLPSFEDLENPNYDAASIVLSANNSTLGKYYIENRELVDFNDLSPNVVKALLATEDERFYGHTGVDFKAFGRVLVKTILMGNESSGGGSTITQQLSKLLFDRPDLSGQSRISRFFSLVSIKLKEWITAIKLEKSYTKEEIMAMYLNKFEFIYGAHGIQAAAQTYFGTNQDNLSVENAAILVGMLKNPALYNPVRFPEQTLVRRNVVLNQMRKHDHLSVDVLDSLKALPLDMSNFKRENHSDGMAPHFRSELTKWLRATLENQNILKEDGSNYNIYTDGLRIYTTIDTNYQKHAEAAVWEHMQELQTRYWKVWKGMNPFRFEADRYQRGLRYDALSRRVHASDRYKNLFERVMGQEIAKISDAFPEVLTSPRVLNMLVDVSERKKSLKDAIDLTRMKSEHKSIYEDLLKSDLWKNYLNQNEKLKEQYEKEFNTEISMTIFAYNDQGEEEKSMTPLDSVIYLMRHLQAGVLSADPKTGHIKAWVGGINHKYFKYDHVNARRQVGSTFKPFVYATAISLMGISPCQEYDDIQYTIAPGDAGFDLEAEWSPANANGQFTGNKFNLYHGLLYSKNSITVRLVKEMGSVEVVRDLVNSLGIDKEIIPPLPSISLGATDLSVREMTGSYTAFANNGIYTEPIFVTKIEDRNGKVIFNNLPKRNVALNPVHNRVMVDMLRNNVAGRFALAGVKSKIGGKTGTTNDYADGWFMSITPGLVTGVWVGGDEKFVRFYTLEDGQGFVMARPIVEKYIKALENDEFADYDPDLEFEDPGGNYKDLIDCDKFKPIKAEEEQNQRKAENIKKDEFDEEFDELLEEEFEEEF